VQPSASSRNSLDEVGTLRLIVLNDVAREGLPVGAAIAGPAIVAQLDTTILIDPGATATVDAVGNLVIAVGARPA
jgi:hypothetical protein